MTDKKGAPTMSDIAHGTSGSGGGRVDTSGLEPILRELIEAVRQVAITVNVPSVGAPDVHFHAPAPAPAQVKVMPAGAVPAPIVYSKVLVPRQWPFAIFIGTFFLLDLALKLLEIIKG